MKNITPYILFIVRCGLSLGALVCPPLKRMRRERISVLNKFREYRGGLVADTDFSQFTVRIAETLLYMVRGKSRVICRSFRCGDWKCKKTSYHEAGQSTWWDETGRAIPSRIGHHWSRSHSKATGSIGLVPYKPYMWWVKCDKPTYLYIIDGVRAATCPANHRAGCCLFMHTLWKGSNRIKGKSTLLLRRRIL